MATKKKIVRRKKTTTRKKTVRKNPTAVAFAAVGIVGYVVYRMATFGED